MIRRVDGDKEHSVLRAQLRAWPAVGFSPLGRGRRCGRWRTDESCFVVA
jgi:hypothetical protein